MTEHLCGTCKRIYVRWNSSDETGCPRAEYKDSSKNRVANDVNSSACDYYEPKHVKKVKIDMAEMLKILNQHKYICPTDSEDLLIYTEPIYKPAKSFVFETLEKNYEEGLTKHLCEEAYAHLQRSNYVERESINNYTDSIPLKNGLLNLTTRTLEKQNSTNHLTFCYNTNFKEKADCPKFKKFVAEILPDKQDQLLLQEIMGYCLLPAMPFHKMFWFYGVGRNGKGVIIRTLQAILGKDNTSELNLSEFSEGRRFSLSRLYGKLVNVSSEPKLTKYGVPTNILKMVTGEDKISAELKGKNKRLEFTNVAKLIVLGNRFPKVNDNSLGWWDRVQTLEFPNTFTGEDCIPHIENDWIPEELDGILNWMLEGLYRLCEKNGFTKSQSAEETKKEFMKMSDPISAWLLEKVVYLPNVYIKRGEALENYKDYCFDLGVESESDRAFYKVLRNTPRIKDTQKKVNGNNEHVFEGIALKTKENTETDPQTTLDGSKSSKSSKKNTLNFLRNISNNLYKESVKISATPATSATKNSVDIDEIFPAGGATCFACKKIIADDSRGERWSNNFYHSDCLQKIWSGYFKGEDMNKEAKVGESS